MLNNSYARSKIYTLPLKPLKNDSTESVTAQYLRKKYFITGIEQVTVHTPLSREVFWHEYAKIPRHTSQNSIAAGNLE